MLANIFQPLIDIFEPLLVFIYGIVGSWGWAIVGMTVLIRSLLLPLAIKQYRSMRALSELAPEIKKLQEKYKNDKQRQQQEMMKFYQENKVNPFASCLPLVAQLPVFLALFYLLQQDLKIEICGPQLQAAGIINSANEVLNSDALKSTTCGSLNPPGNPETFLFIPDLTAEATGWVLIVLIVLYVTSQLLSSILMPSTVDKTQRMIFMALPFIFVPFIINFPAGLILYWITTNLWTVGQQVSLRKIYGAPKPPEPGEGPFSGLMDQLRGGQKEPAAAAAGAGGNGAAAKSSGEKKPAGAPPSSPRKRKKRSGRRR
ncbi:membrane protein insertase YidC [Svornostia abyssi]|uniref:Membrane protein insertase YidC n=1 Tax=Svornostia abyssi TaxID=2898438 RepID=A0ABY5PJ85_9ACTN|nr:membrane protein insertase YidC [Parviterribacteraceae bacterium J379]